MAKLSLTTITSRYASVDALNANFEAIEEALENTLSRDGTAPNVLEADIDVNGNRIINLPTPLTSGEPINLGWAVANYPDFQTVAGLADEIEALGDIVTEIVAVYGGLSNIATVASGISNVNAVGSNITSVNTVATNISNVNNVNTNIADVSTVATNIGSVNTTAGAISNVNTVAGSIASVNTVSGISSDVTAVALINGDVTTVSGISADVTTVAADGTDIGTVATNIANVNTVAGISGNVTTVAGDSANIGTVAGNIANVNTVAGISTDISAVNANSANISLVAGINSDVTTVATYYTDLQTVAADIDAVVTAANDLNEAVSEIDTVANNIAIIDTVGTSIADVSTVAANIVDVNAFADTYFISATPPGSPTTGDLWYDTANSTLKVYDGSWGTIQTPVVIDDLNDVDTITLAPSDGMRLVWNDTSSKWEPSGLWHNTYTSAATLRPNETALANTSGGAFTLTLPASPSAGDFVNILDATATFNTNNLTIGRNGNTIQGSATDLICDIDQVHLTLQYTGSDWRVYASVGATDGTVATLNGTETLTNKTLTSPTLTSATLTNPTINNYTEGTVANGTFTTTFTFDLTNGTLQTGTLQASTAHTFTMPTATAGKSFILILNQAASTGNGTATFTGVLWAGGSAPTVTAAAGSIDMFSFVSDGTNWYGSVVQDML